jgi:small subunit ribosomal protein S8
MADATKNKVTNDPISDYLTRIRNALLINKKTVLVPFSKIKLALSELLQKEGYIKSYSIVNNDDVSTKSIEIVLKYVNKKPAITGLKRYSKPGLRQYTKSKYAPRVFNGLGICVLSTNKGLLTDRKARAEKAGGELLCTVW